MSIDELRAGFSRVAAQTRPAANPYGRLISRRRTRSRLRVSAFAAALLAAAVSTPLALQAGTAPAPPAPGLNPWVKRLIESPTRGGLAGDTALMRELEQAFAANRERHSVPSGMDRMKILLADDILGYRHVVVAHYSETSSFLVRRWAAGQAGVDELMNGGSMYRPSVDPFIVEGERVDQNTFVAFGLAPAGCVINTPESSPADIRDYVARAAARMEVWRVSCDGREMEARTVVPGRMFIYKPDPAAVYRDITGRDGAVRWDHNDTIVVGPLSGTGPAFLMLGDLDNGVLALEPPGATPSPSTAVDGPSVSAPPSDLISTGNAYADGDIVVIRLPQREGGNVVLSNQLLVLGPAGTRAEALDADGKVLDTGGLDGGLGYLSVAVGAATRIRVGPVSFDFHEPAAGPRIFEQPLFSNWG
ncbi:hypothetical protein [Allorhizocola rhizosphaerae]|uniref:hypothetical protein n=1 Tax=Allorhizocola rhizosphaerae TaxID=1872709 RepID=UPI000E3BB34E|nr:hypothetical protein [Allorhizocola rhizosphaerae]